MNATTKARHAATMRMPDPFRPKPYLPDPYRPANVNMPDPDFAPARSMHPPTPPFNAEAEIRAMGDRLRWLAARDNDAPRYMLEYIDAVAYEENLSAELAEDRDRDAKIHEKETTELGVRIEDLESHINKLIDLIDDLSEGLTPDEQDEPENVSAFFEGYARREAAIHQYLADNMLRK